MRESNTARPGRAGDVARILCALLAIIPFVWRAGSSARRETVARSHGLHRTPNITRNARQRNTPTVRRRTVAWYGYAVLRDVARASRGRCPGVY